ERTGLRGGMTDRLRVKSVEQSIADTDEPDSRLRKDLSWWDLTVFGVSVVIGAGIFTVTASTAGNITGPAISVSFIIAAIACGLAALCFAEFASTAPGAASDFTCSYASIVFVVVWTIAWQPMVVSSEAAPVDVKGRSSYPGKSFRGAGASPRREPIPLDRGAM